ncbi:hypothetical protein [Burkholderia anthina]|uniref:hypothetical protein n=1 Tax=Burkholderia anthina TaxID=179879 RepID=UPI001E617815
MTIDMQERVSPDIVRAAQAGLIDAGIVAGDVLRRRIRDSNFETACRMIEANVGVLPEGTARRHAKTMVPRLVALEDDWAERRLRICVADLDAPPRFARDFAGLLVEDARGQPD